MLKVECEKYAEDFSALAAAASELTEILRGGSFAGADAAFIKVKAEYDKVIRAINAAKQK